MRKGRGLHSEYLSVRKQGSIGREKAALMSSEDPKPMYMACEGLKNHSFLHHPMVLLVSVNTSRECI